MFTVELYARIRRAVMADGLSRREVAKRFGVHRNTITKMLQFSVPPGYRRRERPASKKLGPYMAWIDAILEGDRSVHKNRILAKRMATSRARRCGSIICAWTCRTLTAVLSKPTRRRQRKPFAMVT